MAQIQTYTEKIIIADDDLFVIADSAAGDATKKVKKSNILSGVFKASAGAVGAPSYTFTGNLTDGYYSVSANQLGTAINGALVGGWNAAGLFTGQITEQITNSGVVISGAAALDATFVLKIAAATLGANVGTQIQLDDSPTPTTLAAGNIWNDSTSKGLSFVDGNGNTVALVRNTGWTASAGTESKAGIDSDDVIYTVGALQNLARTVAAIQNTLMNTHGLIGT